MFLINNTHTRKLSHIPEAKIDPEFVGLIITCLNCFDVIPEEIVKYSLSGILASILINYLYVGFKEMKEQRLVCHMCRKRIKTKIILEEHECETNPDS